MINPQMSTKTRANSSTENSRIQSLPAMTAAELQGTYVAIVTPFEKSNDRVNPKINFQALDQIIEKLINSNINGVVLTGCTGYASHLTIDEQFEVFKYTNDKFGNIPNFRLIAGDGANSTREAIHLSQLAEKAGIMTHLSISPYKVKPSDTDMIEHYHVLSDNLEGNIILYSVPGRTGGPGITPFVAEKLSHHPKIIGIKDASGDINRIKDTIDRTYDSEFSVVSGDDGIAIDVIENGGRGLISVAANLAPREVSKMINYALKKYLVSRCHGPAERDKLTEDILINQKLGPLYSALFPKARQGTEEIPSPNPCLCYYGYKLLGIDCGIPPLPLSLGKAHEHEAMREVLRGLNLI